MRKDTGEYGYERAKSASVDSLPLFAAPSVAVETSEAAADKIKARLSRLHYWIEMVLVRTHRTGATCEELCEILRVAGNTMRPRLVELEALGKIYKSEDRRHNRSGRSAVVYKAGRVSPA